MSASAIAKLFLLLLSSHLEADIFLQTADTYSNHIIKNGEN